MPQWYDNYLAALQERDAYEQADVELYKAYTSLADRYASVQSAAPAPPASTEEPITPAKNLRPNARSSTPLTASADITRLRADLTEAQRTKVALQTQLTTTSTELQKLQASYSTGAKTLDALAKAKVSLERKVRDREHELREKARLVENVQDEMVSLEMQLNVAEDRASRLEKENKELVERWMKRMGIEAEQMNEVGGWGAGVEKEKEKREREGEGLRKTIS